MAKSSHLKSIDPETAGDKPPVTLGKAGATLWRTVTDQFCLDDAGSRETLLQVCEAKDSLEDTVARKKQAADDKTFQALLKAEVGYRSFIVRGLERLGVGPDKKAIGRPVHDGGGITLQQLNRLRRA
jgi:hypothetical protein